MRIRPIMAPLGAFALLCSAAAPVATAATAASAANAANVTDAPSLARPAAASDTAQVAYVTSDGAIEVAGVDGSSPHLLAAASASAPAWRPDGGQLAYTAMAADGSPVGVHVVGVDGTDDRLVAPGAMLPAWSPDGTRLLVHEPTGSSTGDTIAVIDVASGARHEIFDGAKGDVREGLPNTAVSWAPDGSRLVLSVYPPNCAELDCPVELWVVNADGSGLHQVPNGLDIGYVAWSPDGQWLIGNGLWLVHPDGAGRHQLVAGSLAASPVWSPDGAKIAYTLANGLGGSAMWVLNADGSGAHAVDTPTAPADADTDVRWLPDSRGLVFARGPRGVLSTPADFSIRTVGVDGAGARTLATGTQPSTPTWTTRLAGATRVDTAVSASRATFASATAVVVARDDLYPDALAAGPLAAKLGGPLLLSPSVGAPSALVAEVTRLGATTAYLIGDTTALSAQVEADLRAAGVTAIHRVGGATRYDTAALIAAQVGGAAVYVARGDDWPDAASVAALAAFQRRPIVLTPPAALGPSARDAITSLHATSATIVGGSAAVSDGVETELRAAGVAVTRLSGPTRYATSAAVASAGATAGLTGQRWMADGLDWPDAIAAGPAAAASRGNLVLVDPGDLSGSPETRTWLLDHGGGSVVAVGGPDVLSPKDVVEALGGLLES